LPASDWKRRKSVFSVNYKNQELFAGYQFSANLRPLPVIKKVIDADVPLWYHVYNTSAHLVKADSFNQG
jgi:hypothetical protein